MLALCATRHLLSIFLLVTTEGLAADTQNSLQSPDDYQPSVNDSPQSIDSPPDSASQSLDAKRANMMKAWNGDNVTGAMTYQETCWFNNVDANSQPVARADLPPCMRKELRCLTPKERSAVYAVLNAMKSSVVDPSMGSNQYDMYTINHRKPNAPEAHNGPAFLPFHRFFCNRFEQSMRAINPSCCLPYWDSTLDSFLPNLADSIIWSGDFFGNPRGPVTTGPFANWTCVPDDCAQIGRTLLRRVGNDATMMLSDAEIATFWAQPSFAQACSPLNTYFEDCHGDVHMCIDGHMANLMCSPNDPVFYCHHSFIDLCWEEFRKRHKNTPYPKTNIQDNGPNDPILPWYTSTIGECYNDNTMTTKVYSYAPRPMSCKTSSDCCGSDALWCDVKAGRCKSKVRQGGSCKGLADAACACNGGLPGACQNNVCACPSCAADSDCAGEQWCDTSSQTCADQIPLYDDCTAGDVPNSACTGACPDPYEPMCYQHSCQCCMLTDY